MAFAPDLTAPADDTQDEPMIVEHSVVGDEHLRLVLLCAHPSLDRDAQVALTLRLVGGLTTAEIAAAFLVPESTLAQRIVRAKRKIRDAGIPLTIPSAVEHRIEAVLTVIYLIFNEGYLSRGDGPPLRVDLVDEAVRLTRTVLALLPGRAEVAGLLALELFASARTSARLLDDELVLLEDQDRESWDRRAIEAANVVLAGALARFDPGPFQVQALIASIHANAPSAAETDWARVVALYGQLSAMTGSPIVALNRAVAVSMADGPAAGLAILDRISGLDGYHLLWAARGELLARSGRHVEAVEALRRARSLTVNAAERRHLERRITRM
jgi:RNA polymerase sigma-70 factor (ECF subfamily)